MIFEADEPFVLARQAMPVLALSDEMVNLLKLNKYASKNSELRTDFADPE